VFEAVLAFNPASLATPATNEIATTPSPFGTISAVYTEPEPATLLATPLVTPMSLNTKPLTDSLKVKVTGIGDVLV
jgi:hypothetical protein